MPKTPYSFQEATVTKVCERKVPCGSNISEVSKPEALHNIVASPTEWEKEREKERRGY